jgi:hypothetical protein
LDGDEEEDKEVNDWRRTDEVDLRRESFPSCERMERIEKTAEEF